MLYNFYILSGTGKCLYYEEWQRTKKVNSPEEDQKLMFGLMHSLTAFVTKLSPKPGANLVHFTTDTFRCHVLHAATGHMFVMNTDINVGDSRDVLRHIYSEIYIETVVKNPLHAKTDTITSNSLFKSELNAYLSQIPQFGNIAQPQQS
eukprot:comp14924_c0_seq1/m.22037 comp14924_c0_seq1/g.22037  ORF comp14924_c0_seq1/g.22037 comp14924_c0_seq1/m.22037 type:complete len:148 (+) comp14924_c0_seq1:7-450(+)